MSRLARGKALLRQMLNDKSPVVETKSYGLNPDFRLNAKTMNNQEAKFILAAYRPGGQDASDPLFAEALEQVRRDPDWQRGLRPNNISMPP